MYPIQKRNVFPWIFFKEAINHSHFLKRFSTEKIFRNKKSFSIFLFFLHFPGNQTNEEGWITLEKDMRADHLMTRKSKRATKVRSDIGPPAGVSGTGRFWRHRILVHSGPTIVGAVFYQSPVGSEIGHGLLVHFSLRLLNGVVSIFCFRLVGKLRGMVEWNLVTPWARSWWDPPIYK